MNKKPFWEDGQQAHERLSESVILYDGSPCYVRRVTYTDDMGDRIPVDKVSLYCTVNNEGKITKGVSLLMSDEKFNNFRDLPPLGWFNSLRNNRAYYGSRQIVGTRTHGMSSRNTTFRFFISTANTGLLNHSDECITTFFKDEGFYDACKGDFPSLEETLREQKEDSSVALSPLYCILRNDLGVRYLFRETVPIGIFTGVDTLYLFSKKNFYREEIQENPLFTINTIQEF